MTIMEHYRSCGETILSLLNHAVDDVEVVTAKMRNKEDNNAYRLLSVDDGDALCIPSLAYRLILERCVLQLGSWKGEIKEAAIALEDVWEEFFDAIGNRIREAHADLENARKCWAVVNELLQSHLESDNIGVDPDKTAKGALRRFETAIGCLSDAMREELVGDEIEIPLSKQQDDIRFRAVSLIRGLLMHANQKKVEAVSAVHHLLWKEFEKVGLSCKIGSIRQLLYGERFADSPPADEDTLREYNLIK